jgi:hypothetical protein
MGMSDVSKLERIIFYTPRIASGRFPATTGHKKTA